MKKRTGKIRMAVGLSGGPPSRKATEGQDSFIHVAKTADRKNKVQVAVGLSGGVDSAVAAALLVEQGYEVIGAHLVCWEEPGCRAPQDRKDALAVALQLGIPFEVLDFRKEYNTKVIEYFYAEYKAGRTPNPDVMCNREIKFGMFMKWALRKGFDYVATGHYARVRRIRNKPIINDQFSNKSQFLNPNGQTRHSLLQGVDRKKDQSYFLHLLSQEQLAHTLFPVGEMTKEQVRKKAKKLKLPVAVKPDSQGICFLGEIDVREFLKRRIKEKKGEVVIKYSNFQFSRTKQLSNNNVQNVSDLEIRNSDLRDDYIEIGEHRGVWFYTIGQRHGFSIDHRSQIVDDGKQGDFPPLYVVGKDVVHNRLIVGTIDQAKRREFEVGKVHWIDERLALRLRSGQAFSVQRLENILVRIRHGGALIPAKLEEIRSPRKALLRGKQNSEVRVQLNEPAFGVAPGQSAVFYRGEECLGGGIIS